MSNSVQAAACPHCQQELSPNPDQAFCTRCGLALLQPCPSCSSSLATPPGDFTSCPKCQNNFWACRECARLYHLDRTSCLNGYCPKKGEFWTARFGSDTWDSRRGHSAVAFADRADTDPIPGWLAGGAAGERRFPSLHHSGLLISVQESGVIEMWAERGAPHGLLEGDEFREESVCLSRLDLGEPASGAPLLHQGLLVILGSSSLSLLEMTSNPSLSSRLELPQTRGPLRAVSLGSSLLVLAPDGLYEVDVGSRAVLHHLEQAVSMSVEPASDGAGQALLASGDTFMVYRQGGVIKEVGQPGFSGPAEWSLYADRFLLFWRNQLAYLDGDSFVLQELPAAAVARPVFEGDNQRLILLLSDHAVRSCSTTGERFSFVCDMPGVPTTAPLRIGGKVYYGSDGRYLCCDEEAMLPRLNSPPWGELSYANGRLFGTTREGVLFAFCL